MLVFWVNLQAIFLCDPEMDQKKYRYSFEPETFQQLKTIGFSQESIVLLYFFNCLLQFLFKNVKLN